MNPRHLELADEFCKLVGQAHLIEYLGLDEGASPDEARQSLRKRRKYMQGMQSNPKYKGEALFLIKNFAALDAVLADPHHYLEAVSHQQESAHLPILEMTIRTVLKGRSLSLEQEQYLQHQAQELGLSERTFEDTLTRLAAQAGIPRPSEEGEARRRVEEDDVLPDENVEITDHYGLLGLNTGSSREKIYDAYRARYRTVRAMADRERAEMLYKRLDRAWQVLSDPASRETYDLSLRRTGPPARDRAREDPFVEALRQAPTAPPVRSRTRSPAGEDAQTPTPVSASRGRIEFGGPRVRQVRLPRQVWEATLDLRVLDGIEARVTTDEPWLQVEPARLEAGRVEHAVRVRIDPGDLPSKSATGVVTVQTDVGDRTSIVFEVRRRLPVIPLLAGALAAAGLTAAVVAFGASHGWFAPTDRSVTLAVDPAAEDVLVDGVSVGGGSRVVIQDPPAKPVTLTVLEPNYTTWIQQVDLSRYTGKDFAVHLDLATDLSFRPAAGQVQAHVDEAEAQKAMTPRTEAMDACVRQAAGAKPLTGKVRIFIGPSGKAIGVEIEGQGTDQPKVHDCLVRQAAAVHLPPVHDGDYATVRYDYEVAEGPP